MIKLSISLILPLFLTFSIAMAETQPTLHICNDDAEWPPYFYRETDSFGKQTDRIIGATIDTLGAILKPLGIPYSFELMPWKRCLLSVEFYGQDRTYEALTDTSSNAERDKMFLRSDPFYALTFGGFYNRKIHPEGIALSSAKELDSYDLCGTFGYNFEPYYKAGLTRKIDTSAHDGINNLKKLTLERCEVFLSPLETVLGGVSVGIYTIPEEIAYFTIENVEKQPFYMYVSKDSPRGAELIKQVNAQIRKLKAEGRWEAIFRRYTPTGSGLAP